MSLTDTYLKGTVYIDPETGSASFRRGRMDREHGTAYGYYDNSMNETGLAVLEIQTQSEDVVGNRQLMYAAGYLEGVLTAR